MALALVRDDLEAELGCTERDSDLGGFCLAHLDGQERVSNSNSWIENVLNLGLRRRNVAAWNWISWSLLVSRVPLRWAG